jgi:peptide/nickel transport system substrate-binding protein
MKQRLGLLVLVLLLSLPLTLASAQDDTTIVIRNIGNLTTFNPILYNDGASIIAANYLWPQLFEVDANTGEPVPGLTTWEISEDNLTYTFTIRDDAFWSDGTPITSADAKFVIEATQNEDIPSPNRSSARNIQAVNIIDDKTFEIVMSEPSCVVWADFIDFRLVPSARFAADFSDVTTNPLNTAPDVSGGPYILEESRPGEFERYTANPTFWGGEVQTPTLVNRVIEDPAVLIQALQAGEIDYASMRGDEFEQLSDTSNLNFQAFPQNNVSFLALNWADPDNPQPAYDEAGNPVEQAPHPILSDIRVRQAIAMGWNKMDVLESLGGENGGTLIASSVLPTLTWAINPDVQPYPFDPEAAAALLEEAGWVDSDGDGIREKDGMPLALEVTYSDLLAYFETIALVVQDYLTQLGFDITVTKLEWATYLNEVFLGQTFDIAVLSNTGANPPDPDSLARGLTYSRNDVPGSGGNVVSYVNPEYDALLDEAQSIPGCAAEDRAPIYHQIQEIQHNDVVYDFIISPNLIQIMNNRVGGFEPGPWWGLYGFTQNVQNFAVGE